MSDEGPPIPELTEEQLYPHGHPNISDYAATGHVYDHFPDSDDYLERMYEEAHDFETDESSEALHYDAGKMDVTATPMLGILEAFQVTNHGMKKYARLNWEKGAPWHKFVNSALRHIFRFWWLREDFDPDSGKHHLAHAVWDLSWVVTMQYTENGEDDRPPVSSMVLSHLEPLFPEDDTE